MELDRHPSGDDRRAIRDGIDVIQTDYPLHVLRAIELSQKRDSALAGRAARRVTAWERTAVQA